MGYFSNSTDGDYLTRQCETCPANHDSEIDTLLPDQSHGCPILHVQFLYNTDQLKTGQEKLKEAMTVLIDDDGNCRMRPLIVLPEKPKTEPPEWLDDARYIDE